MKKKTNKDSGEVSVDIEISETQKISVSSFKMKKDGPVFVNIRKFYTKKGSKSWMPTRQGITVPLESVKDMRLAIKEIASTADEDAILINMDQRNERKSSDEQ